jgi:hypothetical protein
VTFFFDNTFPPKIPELLRILGVDATHLQDHFPANTMDRDFIPHVGERGWVLVTGDNNQNRQPAEKKALEDNKVIAVFVYRGFTHLKIFPQVAYIVKNWPAIAERVAKVRPGTSLEINVNGKIEIL